MDTAPGCADPSLVQLKTDLATIFGYLDGHSAAATHTRYLMTGYKKSDYSGGGIGRSFELLDV